MASLTMPRYETIDNIGAVTDDNTARHRHDTTRHDTTRRTRAFDSHTAVHVLLEEIIASACHTLQWHAFGLVLRHSGSVDLLASAVSA